MKAKFINEEFVRKGVHTSLDVGEKSTVSKLAIYKKLQKLGIDFNLHWEEGLEEKALDNMLNLNEIVQRLHKLGVKYTDIEISQTDQVELEKSWKITDYDNVLATCLTKEDAENIVSVLKKFQPTKDETIYSPFSSKSPKRFSIVKNKGSLSSPILTISHIPWLDELAANRKMFKNF